MPRDDERMGAFDAVMWGVETDPLLRSVIVVLLVLDREPDRDEAIARVERMTMAVPRLRQRVIGNPVSLVPPRWETDPNFDLEYHLRWFAVPEDDGTLRPALTVAEKLAEQDFDRDRPLWEMVLLTGLPDGRAAVLVKMHHAITDGMGGMAMAAALFSLSRDAAMPEGEAPHVPRANPKDGIGRFVDGVEFESRSMVSGGLRYGTGALRLGVDAVKDPLGSAQSAMAFAASAQRLLAPATSPMSATLRDRSLSLHFAVVERPLADLKRAAKAAGGTVNDAFIAAVAAGLGDYHRSRGDDSTHEVRLNMPVNLRPKGDTSVGGNAWVPARFLVPIVPMDARTRIRRLSPLLLQARTEPALPISGFVMSRLTQLPRPLTAAVAGGMMKGTDVAATNVPGPPIPVYLSGAKVELMVPFAPKGGAAVNVALMSYNGVAQLGINVDTGAVPDPEVLVEALVRGLDDVLDVGREDATAPGGAASGRKAPARKAPVRKASTGRTTAARKAPAKRHPRASDAPSAPPPPEHLEHPPPGD